MEKAGFKLSRLRAAGVHLSLSALLLSLLLLCMYFSGYPWPVWYLQGAEVLFAMVAGVDLCLGPLMTLIVSNPKKARRLLLRDWSIIAVIQIAALFYGAYTLWEGRPLALVVAVNRIDVITANMLKPEAYTLMHSKCAAGGGSAILPNWNICKMLARMPEDTKKKQEILFSALNGGPDLSSMPEYYFQPDEAKADILAALRTPDYIAKNAPTLAPAVKAALAQHKLAENEVKILWILGREKSAGLLYKASDNTFIDTVVE